MCVCVCCSCVGGLPLDVDPVTLLVMVVDAEHPTITITGIKSRNVVDEDLAHGVKLFPDLMIDARTKTEDDELRGSQESSDQVVTYQITAAVFYLTSVNNLLLHVILDVWCLISATEQFSSILCIRRNQQQ